MDFDNYEVTPEEEDMWRGIEQKQNEERHRMVIHLCDLWWLANSIDRTLRARKRVLRLAKKAGLLNEFKQSIAN